MAMPQPDYFSSPEQQAIIRRNYGNVGPPPAPYGPGELRPWDRFRMNASSPGMNFDTITRLNAARSMTGPLPSYGQFNVPTGYDVPTMQQLGRLGGIPQPAAPGPTGYSWDTVQALRNPPLQGYGGAVGAPTGYDVPTMQALGRLPEPPPQFGINELRATGRANYTPELGAYTGPTGPRFTNGPGGFPTAGDVNLPAPPGAGGGNFFSRVTSRLNPGGVAAGAGKDILGGVRSAGPGGLLKFGLKGVAAPAVASAVMGYGGNRLNQWAGIGQYGTRTDPRGEAGQSLITGAEQGAGLGLFAGPGGAVVGGVGAGLGNLAAQPVQALLGRDPSQYSIGNVFDNVLPNIPGGKLAGSVLGLGSGGPKLTDENGNPLQNQDAYKEAAKWQKKMKTAQDKGDTDAAYQAQNMAYQWQQAGEGKAPPPGEPGDQNTADQNTTATALANANPDSMIRTAKRLGISDQYAQALISDFNSQVELGKVQAENGIGQPVPADKSGLKPAKPNQYFDVDGKEVKDPKVDPTTGKPNFVTVDQVPTEDQIKVQAYNQFLNALPAIQAQQQQDASYAQQTAMMQAALQQYGANTSYPGQAALGSLGSQLLGSIPNLPANMQAAATDYALSGINSTDQYNQALGQQLQFLPGQLAAQQNQQYQTGISNQIQQAQTQQMLAQQYPELFGPKKPADTGFNLDTQSIG